MGVDAPVEIVVIGERLSGDSTLVRLDEVAPSEDLGDVLADVTGLTVRRVGGPLDYATVSIRGSSARQVLVLLDGIPLNPDGSAVVDLSELSLVGLDHVEVYRTGVPLHVAAAPIGGAILLTSGVPSPSVQAQVGSFGSVRIRGGGGDEHIATATEVVRTDGNFPVYDDNGTRFDGLDDHLTRRENNAATAASSRVRWGQNGRVGLLDTAIRDEGVPGPLGASTSALRLRTVRILGGGGVDRTGPRSGDHIRGWGLWRDETLDDRSAEVDGEPDWHRDRVLGVGGSASTERTLNDSVTAGLVATARGEGWQRLDRLNLINDPLQPRFGAVVGADLRFALGSIRLAPSLLGSTLVDPVGGTVLGAVNPRLATTWEGGALRLHGAFATGFRPPDLDELYVDRGGFHGNPDLAPERALGGEVGAKLAGGRSVTGSVEIVGSARDTVDAIVWLENAARVWVPANLGKVRVLGAEGCATLNWGGRFETTAGLTSLYAVVEQGTPDAVGNRVPGVPPVAANGSVAGTPLKGLQLGWDASFAAPMFLDLANAQSAPVRWVHDAFLSVGPVRKTTVELAVHNVLDRFATVVDRDPLAPEAGRGLTPVVDWVGYPLPGRSVWVSVAWAGP